MNQLTGGDIKSLIVIALLIIIFILISFYYNKKGNTNRGVQFGHINKKAKHKDIKELTLLVNKLLDGMTKKDLARRMGVSGSTIHKLSYSKISRPSTVNKYLLEVRQLSDLILPNIK